MNGIQFVTETSILLITPPPFIFQREPQALSQGMKSSEFGSVHQPSSCAKINNVWNYTSIPPYIITTLAVNWMMQFLKYQSVLGAY
jgi:hypothetical protein